MHIPLSRWLLVFATTIAGCEVGPNYHAPKTAMPPGWHSPPTTRTSIAVERETPVELWWTTFHDPELNSLIERAVRSNLTVEAATERIIEARASLGVTTAGFFPGVSLNSSYSRNFSAQGGSVVTTSGNGVGTTTGGSTVTKTIGPRPHDLWQAGLDATWELDIFGGIRRGIESAAANLQAAVEDRRDVLVTLLGEVATDYILLRGYQQEIVISGKNLAVQDRNSSLARQKKNLGTATDLDIAQADALVASTNADIATLKSLEQQTTYSLSVLLALQPTALDQELSSRELIPLPPPVVPIGLPSDLLRRRPDIRRAERQLAAATAQIGVATADLFPHFAMNGTLTLQGSRYEALSNWGTRFWSFGPSFSWPVFDAGRIWANIHVQNAVQAQALTLYKQTVLTALQDVQNALVAYAREQERRTALYDAVKANQRAVELATKRYNQGLTDYLNVIDAERSLFSSQDALVQSNRAVGTDLVALYKA
ncbi:MAG TPA: efflux transporter outer membrane subunit, partial [Tepidisphaeraceae bacterium]|nr:efflux transporter outer membrane subunit [Tepidisphaeraceae bacterium]